MNIISKRFFLIPLNQPAFLLFFHKNKGKNMDIKSLYDDGWSDDEIVGKLKSEYKDKYKFKEAKAAGISAADIVKEFQSRFDSGELGERPQDNASAIPQIDIKPEQTKETSKADPYSVPVEIETTSDKSVFSSTADTLLSEISSNSIELKQSNQIEKTSDLAISKDEAKQQEKDGIWNAIKEGLPKLPTIAKTYFTQTNPIAKMYKETKSEISELESYKEQVEDFASKYQNITGRYRHIYDQISASMGDEEKIQALKQKAKANQTEMIDLLKNYNFVNKIATDDNGNIHVGFDGADDYYEIGDTGFMEQVLNGLTNSKFEIGGSIIGGMALAWGKKALKDSLTDVKTYAGSPQSALFKTFIKGLTGSAIGTFFGAGIDGAVNSADIGKPLDYSALFDKSVDAAAADAIFGSGLAVGGKAITSVPKVVVPSLKVADKLTDAMPVIGLVKQGIKGLPDANLKGA